MSIAEFLKDLPSHEKSNFSLFNTENGIRTSLKRPSVYVPTVEFPSDQVIVTERKSILLRYLHQQWATSTTSRKRDSAILAAGRQANDAIRNGDTPFVIAARNATPSTQRNTVNADAPAAAADSAVSVSAAASALAAAASALASVSNGASVSAAAAPVAGMRRSNPSAQPPYDDDDSPPGSPDPRTRSKRIRLNEASHAGRVSGPRRPNDDGDDAAGAGGSTGGLSRSAST